MHKWRNLRSLSRKPTRGAGNIVLVRKMTVTPTLPEAWGTIVPEKKSRNCKNFKINPEIENYTTPGPIKVPML